MEKYVIYWRSHPYPTYKIYTTNTKWRNSMKISTKGRYGIRLMLCLALQYEKSGHMPLKMIAQQQEVSEKYLEQIINPLTKAGLVQSFRGAQGGYALIQNPSEITVGTILRILEGSLSPVDCLEHSNCKRADFCASLSLWQKIKTAIDDIVDNTTLADLVAEYHSKNDNTNIVL